MWRHIVALCLHIPPRHCEGVSPKQSSIPLLSLSGLLRAIALAMTWRNVEECGGMWRNVEECEGMWRHIVALCLHIPPRHCEGVSPKQSGIPLLSLSGLLRAIALAMTWRNVEECGGMWRNVEECEGMWRHIVALCLHIPPRHCEGVSPKQSRKKTDGNTGLLRAIALAMTWRHKQNYTLHNIIPCKIKQGGVCPLVIENNNSTTIV